jgi:hypothetical protein
MILLKKSLKKKKLRGESKIFEKFLSGSSTWYHHNKAVLNYMFGWMREGNLKLFHENESGATQQHKNKNLVILLVFSLLWLTRRVTICHTSNDYK